MFTRWLEEVRQDRNQVEKILQSCIIPISKRQIKLTNYLYLNAGQVFHARNIILQQTMTTWGHQH